MDESKSVEVEFERNESRFRVWIRDQGRGFDWNNTADRARRSISIAPAAGAFFS